MESRENEEATRDTARAGRTVGGASRTSSSTVPSAERTPSEAPRSSAERLRASTETAGDSAEVIDLEGTGNVSRISSSDVLGLLREYRAAETTSRREARRETAMGETDLIAMRLLVDAEADGRRMTPGMIASALGISTASTTALIDRLAAAGFAERRPHETDRRSSVVIPTVRSDQEVREALGRMQANLARVADDMSQHEIDVVARFLSNMITAVRDTPGAS